MANTQGGTATDMRARIGKAFPNLKKVWTQVRLGLYQADLTHM